VVENGREQAVGSGRHRGNRVDERRRLAAAVIAATE
jgi:hypothetical protein